MRESAATSGGPWVISEPRRFDADLRAIDPEADPGPAKAYRISPLARYLLHPGPIEIRKRLIGAEIHAARRGLRFPRLTRRLRGKPPSGELLLSGLRLRLPPLRDPDLRAHLEQLADALRPYDPFQRRLARLDPRRLAHVVGVCEDPGNGYTYLKLLGTTEERLRYLAANVGREVRIVVHRAHSAEGVFELRACPPGAFGDGGWVPLVAYGRAGQAAACVLTPSGRLDFRLAAAEEVRYLMLLEASLRQCREMCRALASLREGALRPLRLTFEPAAAATAEAETALPPIFRELLPGEAGPARFGSLIRPALQTMRTAVTLSGLRPAADGGEELVFIRCVLHDLRALEPLRRTLPSVYAEISRRAVPTEAGRLYVLEESTGVGHVE